MDEMTNQDKIDIVAYGKTEAQLRAMVERGPNPSWVAHTLLGEADILLSMGERKRPRQLVNSAQWIIREYWTK